MAQKNRNPCERQEGEVGTQQTQRYTKACVSRTRPPASARGDGGTGQQIRGPEGPEYSVPEEAALLTEWMMPCRA